MAPVRGTIRAKPIESAEELGFSDAFRIPCSRGLRPRFEVSAASGPAHCDMGWGGGGWGRAQRASSAVARVVVPLLAMLALAGCGGSPEPPTAQSDAPGPAASVTSTKTARPALESPPVEQPHADPPDQDGDGGGSLRTWKGADGRPLFAAEFISLLDGKVCVQKSGGEGAVLSLDDLSPDDREFVRRLAPEPEPFDEPAPAAPEPAELAVASARADVRGEYELTDRRKVVIPFDFLSEFDGGRYGRMVGDMIWKKLDRQRGFVIPGSMLDVRDVCAAKGRRIGPDTPLEEVARVVREDFDAHVGIWGSIERAPGHDWDVYDLTIKCVDFSSVEPKVLYEKTNVRTEVVSEVPHVYVQEMLDALYGREPGGPPPVDQLAEQKWQQNPNLVEGGDFEQGAGGAPVGWESRGGQHREPLGGLVRWTAEAGNPSNQVIRFTFDASVGDSYGVMYYSNPFPVVEGATYRFQCRWRSNGPAVKVFIKCYFEGESEYAATPAGADVPGGLEYTHQDRQYRESYRSQQNLKGPKNEWNLHTEDFTVRHTRFQPTIGRVMLYAYLGAGVVEFDDVVLKQIREASASDSLDAPRHSLESTVTLQQMEENERRGAETREQRRQRQDEAER